MTGDKPAYIFVMLAAWLGSVQLQRVVLVVGNISVYVCLFLPLFESMSNAATFYLRVVHSQSASLPVDL